MQEHQEFPLIAEYENFSIQVQWPSEDGYITRVARGGDEQELKARAQIALNLAMGTIGTMSYRVSKAINALEDKVRPNEAEIEFGINLDAEAGALLAKASAGAQLTVKLKWLVEQPERPKIIVK